jgi:hypothetical protein
MCNMAPAATAFLRERNRPQREGGSEGVTARDRGISLGFFFCCCLGTAALKCEATGLLNSMQNLKVD